MKLKVFNIGASGLEEEINPWLAANPKVKIQHVNVVQESGQRLIILIFYEGYEGQPSMPDFSHEGLRHIKPKKNKS